MSSPMQHVDVPMTGWHAPSHDEVEPLSLDGKAPNLAAMLDVEMYVSNGNHPDWMWCVYRKGREKPVAVGMFKSGQSVKLPNQLARQLWDIARAEARTAAAESRS